MKNNIIFLILLNFLVSCNKLKDNEIKLKSNNNIDIQCLPHFSEDPKLEKQRIIIFGEKDNYYRDFSRNELNKIEQLFPVFKDKNPLSPSVCYQRNLFKSYINKNGEEKIIDFQSPLAQDDFYLLYAYYLKQKNGEEKFKFERAKLIQLYGILNDIYLSWSNSLSYHSHQSLRIHACAEYSIFILKEMEIYNDKDSFQKQKELYIMSLTQYVTDQENQYIKENPDIDKESAKRSRKKNLEKINQIQKLITSLFYLDQVRNFEAEYYRINY